MTILNIFATPGMVIHSLSSRAGVSVSYPRGGIVGITERRWRTEFSLCKGYWCCFSQNMAGQSILIRFTHLSCIFPHRIANWNLRTTFGFSKLHIITPATEVSLLPRHISLSTSTPGKSKSQPHLLEKNNIAQSWGTNNLIPSWPGIE